MTAVVGLILDGLQAEAILRSGDADVVVVGRQAMYDPYWARHARHQLAADPRFAGWNEQAGRWLRRRADGLALVALRPDGLPVGDGIGPVSRDAVSSLPAGMHPACSGC
jgi:hypothetical protein